MEQCCGLCKRVSELKKSHLIPRAAYKYARGAGKTGVDGIVKVSTREGDAYYTDEQVVMRLLCGACEDLFSKSGEKIVGQLWANNVSFPLLELLQAHGPLAEGPKFSVYDHSRIDEKYRAALFYFAISIYWRANVWDWGRKGDKYVGSLGPRYEKEFREYLLGAGDLDDVYLLITINSSELLNGLISFPFSNKVGMGRVHNFDLLGLKFSLTVGRHIPSEVKSPFDTLNSKVLFLTAPLEDSQDFISLARSVQNKVEARGRLRKEEGPFGGA